MHVSLCVCVSTTVTHCTLDSCRNASSPLIILIICIIIRLRGEEVATRGTHLCRRRSRVRVMF